ncbi:hypothetical protein HYH03_008173 [Edaphochlamys debaryana]|uniref:LisH domain-containing protein n=1 Tax=Edaphochlamys debaryana TaxID=47281 RepID=A0A835Y2V4_9CHLO|nr:hypothetical protein HYH03_008173 [Edaphochlamys debaryana]|eukprot:KAG2493658.1 hypothetical protein HYH03_008173 [Edaphochlamys debaryana]
MDDPEVFAQKVVMQWLHESGHLDVLRSLEAAVGRTYDNDDESLPEASQLMQLVWRHLETRLQEDAEDAEDAEGGAGAGAHPLRRRRHEEALALLRAGDDDYAGRRVVGEAPVEVHRANVIAVRLLPQDPGCPGAGEAGADSATVITAAGDGAVRCVRMSLGSSGGGSGGGSGDGGSQGGAEVVWKTQLSSAALLTLALHPSYRRGLPLVAVGGMDGSLAVLHGPSGRLLASARVHAKYVVRAAWAPEDLTGPQDAAQGQGQEAQGPEGEEARRDGGAEGQEGQRQGPVRLLLASASMDESVALLGLSLWPHEGAAAEAGPGGGTGWGLDSARAELEVIKQIPYGAAVADVAFLRDCRTLVVGVRGSNYLRLLDAGELWRRHTAGQQSGSSLPEALANMNEAGDDHVSFSAKQLLPSPCGRYLLVLTDSPRLLVMRCADWSVLKLIFGLPVDQFPQPAAAWHRDSNYIYAAGAGAQVCVFHLGSGRLVHRSAPHRVNVRDLDYDPGRNLLASCSFDKTVKLMAGGEEGEGAA